MKILPFLTYLFIIVTVINKKLKKKQLKTQDHQKTGTCYLFNISSGFGISSFILSYISFLLPNTSVSFLLPYTLILNFLIRYAPLQKMNKYDLSDKYTLYSDWRFGFQFWCGISHWWTELCHLLAWMMFVIDPHA